ncbi:hypothetical protein BJY16_008213 [Actinoplanes octamycinicus]|uniref:Endonuclease/exonuclease/phosphatase family protein n=1 Tax=Actinoplanes octamycinicus TaxID=135948 RepID=A0A7W7MC34_9ACTN|nr:hypothetical protein [Actinoplanes octamycinicus]MBB4744754.1 hypothetical protein [Actinoplanes octamycinicus]GIE55336.1 hypothetical protein Aoc01nite_07380 [Actinoplanes octamycinicus]
MFTTRLAVAALTAAFLAVPAPASAAPSGSFKVLSYNVAGLPDILSSAETDRKSATTAIGRRLTGYDVVHVQEDFNYHAYLYAADTHAHRTPTSGGAGIGSGLNSLSSYAYDTDDFERVRWHSCQLDSGDCLTLRASPSAGYGWPRASTPTSTTCTPTPAPGTATWPPGPTTCAS